MPRSPEAGKKIDRADAPRRASSALVIAAVVCVALLVAYLGNAAWNLIHLGQYDTSQFLAAATLPAPFAQQAVSRWVELASAAAFLLLVVLTATTLRAAISRRARRDKTPPFAVAETADVFIADKSRITARPAPIAAPTPMPFERKDTTPDA